MECKYYEHSDMNYNMKNKNLIKQKDALCKNLFYLCLISKLSTLFHYRKIVVFWLPGRKKIKKIVRKNISMYFYSQ